MKTQQIKKGNHYCNWWQRRWGMAPKQYRCEITIGESWWYPKLNQDSGDVNKIFGNSIGDHRQNSVRIGWVPRFNHSFSKSVKIYCYSTVNGVDSKDQHLIGIFIPFEKIIMERNDNVYTFSSEVMEDNYVYTHPKKEGISYWNNPYYGYPNVAPHKIIFETKIL